MRQCVVNDHCPPGNLCVGNTCVVGCSPERGCEAGSTCCDGACVDLQSNTASCGTCGTRCAVPNGAPACVNGTCTIATCTAPFADCDTTASTGCETDTSRTVAHCGGCGMSLRRAPQRHGHLHGQPLRVRLRPGFADCDGAPRTDARSTPAATPPTAGCATAPALPNAAAACAMGACAITTCNAGFGDCDGSASNGCEVDTRTAVSHCRM
ncbi:MAG: hypothetical protein R3A52_24485 [Polyangiales bacterium]